MRLVDGSLEFSPSDLSAHTACPHLTKMSRAAALGEIRRPRPKSAHVDLIREKGRQHEARFLEMLEREGRRILRVPTYDETGFDPGVAKELTEAAIRSRDFDVI